MKLKKTIHYIIKFIESVHPDKNDIREWNLFHIHSRKWELHSYKEARDALKKARKKHKGYDFKLIRVEDRYTELKV